MCGPSLTRTRRITAGQAFRALVVLVSEEFFNRCPSSAMISPRPSVALMIFPWFLQRSSEARHFTPILLWFGCRVLFLAITCHTYCALPCHSGSPFSSQRFCVLLLCCLSSVLMMEKEIDVRIPTHGRRDAEWYCAMTRCVTTLLCSKIYGKA